MTYLLVIVLSLFFTPLVVYISFRISARIIKSSLDNSEHDKQPKISSYEKFSGRYFELYKKYEYLYDLKDTYHLTRTFIHYFEKLKEFSQDDYVSNIFYHSHEHRTYDNVVLCFENIAKLHEDKCLFSVNIAQILNESTICIVYSRSTPKERIEKFMSLEQFKLSSSYTYEINKIVDKNLDLKPCSSLVFVEAVDYLSALNSNMNSSTAFKFMLEIYEKDFTNKYKEVYEYYNFKIINNLSIYRNKKIQKEILDKLDYLIDNLPAKHLEKRVRLLSIQKEVNNLQITISQDLFVNIQEEIEIILDSYSNLLEKEVNKDNIEVQAFYRYLKTVSKDTL